MTTALCLSLAGVVSAAEKGVANPAEQTDVYELTEQLLETRGATYFAGFPVDSTTRVVILDAHGNKIREERLQPDQSFCGSTLTPMIYRCSFIAEVYGVCYYLLGKI